MIERKDFYFKKAKKEGYLARSSYKLIELNKKYGLIKRGDSVLDIGCSPGSWIQVCLELGVQKVSGIDVKFASLKDKKFSFFHDDLETVDIKKLGRFNVVLSDVAPSTKGHFDAEESVELSRKAWDIAEKVLLEKGNFLCKVFQGNGFNELAAEVRKKFSFFKISKPKASRNQSREMYIVGKGYKKIYK